MPRATTQRRQKFRAASSSNAPGRAPARRSVSIACGTRNCETGIDRASADCTSFVTVSALQCAAHRYVDERKILLRPRPIKFHSRRFVRPDRSERRRRCRRSRTVYRRSSPASVLPIGFSLAKLSCAPIWLIKNDVLTDRQCRAHRIRVRPEPECPRS